MGWLEGWAYRRLIQFQKPGGFTAFMGVTVSLADIAVEIGVDLDYVAFTKADGVTPLAFIEFGEFYGDNAHCYGVTEGLPVFTASIYLYYGPVSPSPEVLICQSEDWLVCDDFADESIDSEKWTTVGTQAFDHIGEETLDSIGRFYANHKSVSNSTYSIRNKVLFEPGVELVARIKLGVTTNEQRTVFVGFGYGGSGNIGLKYTKTIAGVNAWIFYVFDGVHEAEEYELTGLSLERWTTVSVRWREDGLAEIRVGDNTITSSGVNVCTSERYAYFYVAFNRIFSTTEAKDCLDYLAVREIADLYEEEDPIIDDEELPITAGFSANLTSARLGQVIQFTDESTSNSGEIISWLWDFGDSSTSDEQHPIHAYSAMGAYDVSLSIVNDSDDSDSEAKAEYISVVSAECEFLEDYLTELRHMANIVESDYRFPSTLLETWVYKDLCALAIRLGGAINQRYRHISTATLGETSAERISGVSHVAGATTLTGFTGLTVNEYAGGAVLCVSDSKFYSAGILSNTETEVTILLGGSIPALDEAEITISTCSSGGVVSILSLNGIDQGDMIWHVREAGGKPLARIPADMASNVSWFPDYTGRVFWYQRGSDLHIVIGPDTTWSGVIEIGFYRRPFKSNSLADCVDIPIEYVSLAQALTVARIRAKQGRFDESIAISYGVNAIIGNIITGNAYAVAMDRLLGDIRK